MLFFLALSCLAAAALGSVAVYQRGATLRLTAPDGTARLPPKGEGAEARRLDVTLDNLEPGDVVLDGNDDYLVTQLTTYREEQDAWRLVHLDAGTRQRLLEVQRQEGRLKVALLDVVDDAPIHGQLGAGLTYRNKALTLERRGDAWVGEADRARTAPVRYARYAGPGGALLIVEESTSVTGEGQKRALFGEVLLADALQIYPHA